MSQNKEFYISWRRKGVDCISSFVGERKLNSSIEIGTLEKLQIDISDYAETLLTTRKQVYYLSKFIDLEIDLWKFDYYLDVYPYIGEKENE